MDVEDDLFAYDATPSTNSGMGVGGVGGQQQQQQQSTLRSVSHPVVALFHLAFKAAAVLLFVLGGGSIGTFSGCIVLLALDFWVTKNVTGRKMVGLRWWNAIDEGWVFESRDGGDSRGSTEADRYVFWGALFGASAVWGLFLVLMVLTVKVRWAVVCGAGVMLTGSNLVGYVKCSKDAQSRVQAQATVFVMNAVLSRFGKSTSNTPSS